MIHSAFIIQPQSEESYAKKIQGDCIIDLYNELCEIRHTDISHDKRVHFSLERIYSQHSITTRNSTITYMALIDLFKWEL